MKRFRPDLDTAVILLMDRVSNRYVEDWEKSRRILRFVHFTLKEKKAFGATNIEKIFTWVDESCAVHYDMNIQYGCVIYM